MKLTTKQLKQMIKEELSALQSESMDHGEMAQRYYPEDDSERTRGTQFWGDLKVSSKPEGGWKITGTFNNQSIDIDSDYKNYPADSPPNIGEWSNSPRFMMARELLGHFGKGNEHFNIRMSDLDDVKITVDGHPV
jgi:hypothetical protein